jgi:phage N-6-adenine-methyltransferase
VKKAPRQGVDLNEGVYGTPRPFLDAVEKEFPIGFDLASSDENCVVPMHFTVEDDALAWRWIHVAHGKWNWLNPPFDDIGKWAKKAYEESLLGARVLFLVPASVGSNWFRDWVYGKSEVRYLNGRLTFVGHKGPYPKDLMLCIYELGREPKQTIWNWRT